MPPWQGPSVFTMRCLFSLDASPFIFEVFFFFFHIGVFLFFLCAASSSTGPSIWPFCSCCKPSVFVIITAHVKDYDTAAFAFYYDRYSCMKLDALESLVPFGSSTFFFLFFSSSSSSHFLFNIFVIYIRVFHSFSSPAHNCTTDSPVESIRFTFLG